jgi:hypothetical protein
VPCLTSRSGSTPKLSRQVSTSRSRPRDGNLDIFGEPAGAPPYQELKRRASLELIEGLEIRVASLDHLIAMKQAAGRTKDTLLASQLRTL